MRRISPSAEAELLLTSIDVASQPAEKTARIRQIVGRGLDWNSLVRRASAHRLVGLLSRTLEGEAGALGIPLEAFAALRLHRLSHAAYADRSISQLAVLMNDFHRAGVAALILKGPALSLQAYGDIATRDFSDIDLLVRRSEVVAAADVLARAGFRARTYDRNAFAAGFFRNTSDAFCSADDACLIDLHWKIGDWYFPFGPDDNSLWTNLEKVHWQDYEFTTLGAADHLLLLCAHSAKHGWPNLASIADIATLLNAHPELDPIALMDEATRLGFRRVFLVGMLMASKLARAPLTESIMAAIRSERGVVQLAQLFSTSLIDRSEPPTASAKWIAMLRTIGRPRDRLCLLLKLCLTPTGGDRAWLSLPPALYPFYYLIRPLRLVSIGIGAAAMRGRARRGVEN